MGYRAFMVLYPVTGDGVAVMTNGEGGRELRMEVVRAVSRVYDWPDYRPAVKHRLRHMLVLAAEVLIAVGVIVLAIRYARRRRVGKV